MQSPTVSRRWWVKRSGDCSIYSGWKAEPCSDGASLDSKVSSHCAGRARAESGIELHGRREVAGWPERERIQDCRHIDRHSRRRAIVPIDTAPAALDIVPRGVSDEYKAGTAV